MTDTTLRVLVDLRTTMQQQRIRFGNRLDAIMRDADDDSLDGRSETAMRRWFRQFGEIEAQADEDIRAAVKEYPIYEHIARVRGVGPLLAAQLVAFIDIERAETVSALWRYAGYAVIDGERERPRKGVKLAYNARLKRAMYLIGTSFLRSNSPYRRVYDDSREYYAARRPEWTKMHVHMASMRRMNKMFLSHLWLVWREMEGLSTRAPYVEERLGHEHITRPEEFGWCVAELREKPIRI